MGIPQVFKELSGSLVRMGGGGATVELRLYKDVLNQRTTTRQLVYGPVTAYSMHYLDHGRGTAGATRSVMLAGITDPDFDQQLALGGRWTMTDEFGKQTTLSSGITGLRPDGVTVAYWTAELPGESAVAGQGMA